MSVSPRYSPGHYTTEWRRKGGEGDGGEGDEEEKERGVLRPQRRLEAGGGNRCFNPSEAAPASPCSLVTAHKEGAWEGQGLGGRPAHGAEAGWAERWGLILPWTLPLLQPGRP